VADVRAATPSQAAELVVSEKAAVVEALDDLRRRLHRAAVRPLRDLDRRVDETVARLGRAARAALERAAHRHRLAGAALGAASPLARLARDAHRLERLDARLRTAMRHAAVGSRHRLEAAAGRLHTLSPLAVLGRGYSLTLGAGRRVVRAWREVAPGDRVRVLLGEGSLDCRVDAARERDDRPAV
jgi:exodeoxyribonuclease VII large subunit